MQRGHRGKWPALACGLAVVLVVGTATAGGRARHAHAAFTQQCADPYPGKRDPANPLMLPTAPGANPLNGARFFVDGPRHGLAAGAIAQLLGLRSDGFADSYSWASLKSSITGGLLHDKLLQDAGLLHQVTELQKIADEPEAQHMSAYAQGGTPSGIFNQTQKLLCANLTADPGSIPLITTYFLHADARGCPTAGQLRRVAPRFKSQIDAMAAGTGNRPAVYFLELDGIGSSGCIRKAGGIGMWERLLRYEATKIGSLPHTVTYIEAGYSDANSPAYTAKVLNASGVRSVRGFFTNDTHLQWTSREVAWGEKISRKTRGADFVVNTAQNGNGPKLNPHPSSQGIEDLCNPPGRALGPRDTTRTGLSHVDALLWTSTPAISGGSCSGGPKAGTFWAARAIQMAEQANERLGPGQPSRPY